jgi:hypothetical protein
MLRLARGGAAGRLQCRTSALRRELVRRGPRRRDAPRACKVRVLLCRNARAACAEALPSNYPFENPAVRTKLLRKQAPRISVINK